MDSRIYQVCLHLSSQVESNLNSDNIKFLFQIESGGHHYLSSDANDDIVRILKGCC